MGLESKDLNLILDRINQWIFNCDNKSLILVTIIGIFAGIFVTSYVRKLLTIYSYICSHPTAINLGYFTLSIFSIILILIGIWHIIQSIIARTEPPSEKRLINNSLIYYGTISNYVYEEYENKMVNIDEESLKKEIISQIYINSKICTKKFENYNKGLKYSIWGFSLFAVSIIIGYVLCKILWGI